MQMMAACAALLLSLMGVSPQASPQTLPQITGQIRDASGGAMPGATVTVTDLSTGMRRTAVSDSDGRYAVPLLPAGRYRVEVQMDGFMPVTHDAVTLPPGQPLTLDFVLDIGGGTEQVTVTAHAVSGTRFPSKLVETPFAIQVVTADVISDFQLFDTADQLRFVAGASPGAEDTGANNGKRLRGFEPPILRDGFSRANPPDRTTVERVEVIRGPVSTLYGKSSPGGLINYVSKRAQSEPHYNATVTTGSYDFRPFAFGATGPVKEGSLFYFANYSHADTKSDQQYFFNQKDLFALGLTWVATPDTSMTMSWERQRLSSNQGDTIPVYREGAFTAGILWDLEKYNIQGPHNDLSRGFDSGNVLVEHRFSPNLTSRVNLQVYDKDFEEQQYRYGAGNTVQPGGTMTGEAFLQAQDETAWLGQLDLLWRARTGSVNHAFLATSDFTSYQFRNTTFVRPAVRTSPTMNRRPTFDINPWNPEWVDVPRGDITQVFQDTDRRIDNYGAFVSHRAFFLNDRLVTLAGIRYDGVDSRRLRQTDATRVVSANDQTPITTVSDGGGSHEDAWSYTLGANLKLPDDRLVWFVNHSTGFEPTVAIDNGTHQVVPNERSSGIETGLKGSPLGSRLGYTLSFFRIEKTDVAITNPDYDPAAALPTPQFITSGTERSTGVEMDVHWNVTRGFNLNGGGAYIDANVAEPAARRDRLLLAPRATAYLAARYMVRGGPLDGVRLGASLTHTGDYVYNAGSATRFRQVNPAVTLTNAFVGYDWPVPSKATARWRHSVTVNGLNLANVHYLQDTFRLARGREVRLTYAINY